MLSYLRYLPLIMTLVVLQRMFTPLQMWRQVQLMGSWSPFWHSNTCIAANCKGAAVRCFTQPQCIQTIGCINICTLDNLHNFERVAACANMCQMTYGYENEPLIDMMHCMSENGCLVQYPDDGPCIGGNEDAVQTVTKMEDIEGEWWSVRGVSCGEAPYPGAYDWFPCQHQRFIQGQGGQWINNVTYCMGARDVCATDIIVTVANVSLTHPGVVRHDYTDVPLHPQSEDWRLVSFPHEDYALILWCGRAPILNYSGGIVISRKKNDKEMPPFVLKEFREVLSKHGLDWNNMCPSNNENCPI